MEWAKRTALEFDFRWRPQCAGPGGRDGVSAGVRSEDGQGRGVAYIVGSNYCLFCSLEPCLRYMKEMKDAQTVQTRPTPDMAQPNGYRIPDVGSFGWVEIEEFPFGSGAPARSPGGRPGSGPHSAYDLGIRFTWRLLRVRALSHQSHETEELRDARGESCQTSDKSDWDLAIHKNLQKTCPLQNKGDGRIIG